MNLAVGTSFCGTTGGLTLTGPSNIEAAVFTHLSEALHDRGEPDDWVCATHPGWRLHSFIEGPCFDARSHLWLVDVLYGRIPWPMTGIYLLLPDALWPNGLTVDRCGRLALACGPPASPSCRTAAG